MIQVVEATEFMTDEYTAAIATVDTALDSLRALWDDPKYEEIRDLVIGSLDIALDKRLALMAQRDKWIE